MEGRLVAVAASQGGVFLRRQALECGYDADEVKRLSRRGDWVRIRRGAYVPAAAATDDPERRHLLRTRAVVAAAQVEVVVSGVSAALLHGLAMWRPDLSRVQLTHDGVAARIEPDVHHHDAELLLDDLAVVDGVRVTGLARTVVDVARVSDFERGVVIADSALRTGAVAEADLRRAFDRCAQWPGARGVARALGFADGRAQNPAESRTRVALFEGGLPAATPQVHLYDEDHRLLGVVDMALLGVQVVVEFDGRIKYGIDGKDVRTQLFDEKLRERRIYRIGWGVERAVWGDLGDRRRLIANVRAAIDEALHREPARGFYRLAAVIPGGVVPVGPYVRCGERAYQNLDDTA